MAHSSRREQADAAVNISAREILALALPALGVLIAPPLYLLFDTAIVGRLGRFDLAALTAGTTIQSLITTQLTFLSYGTTARSARFFGRGHTSAAVREGVQSTWVALAVGSVLATIVMVFAPAITTWLAGSEDIGREAARWLRIAALGVPLILVIMAGNGWMRGVQDAVSPLFFTLAGVIPGAVAVPFFVAHWGLVGSAFANVLGASITATCFLIKLLRSHSGSWLPDWSTMRSQLVLGRDLILRSLSFQATFLAAAAVAARAGEASLAAHQILLQLWSFISLVLDSLGIAAQSLTGAALGKGTYDLARKTGIQVTRWSMLFAALICVIMAVFSRHIPALFTPDNEVRAALAGPWWLLVIMVLLGGIVFALDGILLGAADANYLRTISIASVLCGFFPAVILAQIFHTGLLGIWFGLVLFILIRLGAVAWRFHSMRWVSNVVKE
ncbi:MATE family efflux transporter [Corynebacterium poyangense]|uniref:MATE family efflux transporter n=1 Tax=Corynebacterium poyangense TaxID=2684405 RepID=A0A7H0SPG2_9CORY|nr:MATE family efflux transporter [Corynebacterium poyangense]MBZ8178017.1 MATE family efflux transporter [Corynebacterium poyangense]QNQ90437.1 MATE family efflux transporter [Corynebacterium poyangense]